MCILFRVKKSSSRMFAFFFSFQDISPDVGVQVDERMSMSCCYHCLPCFVVSVCDSCGKHEAVLANEK